MSGLKRHRVQHHWTLNAVSVAAKIQTSYPQFGPDAGWEVGRRNEIKQVYFQNMQKKYFTAKLTTTVVHTMFKK